MATLKKTIDKLTYDELKYVCRSYEIKYTSAEKKEELFDKLSNYMNLVGLEATKHDFSSILEPSIDLPQKEGSENLFYKTSVYNR